MRQTDGQTDILTRHSPRYAYASRGKKNSVFTLPPATNGGNCAFAPSPVPLHGDNEAAKAAT